MSREDRLIMIGEMGLDISALDSMSDEDLSLLYQGYQRKIVTLGNLIILAIRKAYDPDCAPFDLPQNMPSREETFKNLGIEEDEG